MTTFAARHTRLVATFFGLTVFFAFGGFQFVWGFTTRDGYYRTVMLASLVLAGALVFAWWKLAQKLREAPGPAFTIRKFHGRPAFVTPDSLLLMSPLGMFIAGGNLSTVRAWNGSLTWWWPSFIIPVLVAFWLLTVAAPPFVRLAGEGLILRRSLRRRTIPWDAIHDGESPTHKDKDGGRWILVDQSVRARRYDKLKGRPDGPPGYHWVRAFGADVVDAGLFERAVRRYRSDPQARARIGAAPELDALLSTEN